MDNITQKEVHICLDEHTMGEQYIKTPEEERPELFDTLLLQAGLCPNCRRIVFNVFSE